MADVSFPGLPVNPMVNPNKNPMKHYIEPQIMAVTDLSHAKSCKCRMLQVFEASGLGMGRVCPISCHPMMCSRV